MMRELIRRILREEYSQPKIEEDIMGYTGKDKFINYLKYKIRNGSLLTREEIEYAEDFFEEKIEIEPQEKNLTPSMDLASIDKQKQLKRKLLGWSMENSPKEIRDLIQKAYDNELFSSKEIDYAEKYFEEQRKLRLKSYETMEKKVSEFKGSKDQRSLIQDYGKKVYLDIVKSDLSIFLNDMFNPKFNLKIGRPGDFWFKKNLEDLDDFKSYTKKYHSNVIRDFGMTILEKITELEKLLNDKDWFGIIENEDWSSLNKVDTHYTSWAKDITKRQVNNDLPMGGDLSVIDKYFEKRDIRDVLPERWLEKLRNLKKEGKDLNISKMSFAEADFVRKFHEEKEEFFKELKADIQKTTEKGDQAEIDFESYLRNYPEKVNNIKSYSSPGNVVDMIFGVDGRFHVNSGDYFFQVKNSEYGAKPAFIKKLRIPYVSVYPKGISGQKFNYFSNINRENPSDFDNFIDNSVDLPKTLSPYERQNAALNKVLGQTGGFGSDYFKLYGNS